MTTNLLSLFHGTIGQFFDTIGDVYPFIATPSVEIRLAPSDWARLYEDLQNLRRADGPLIVDDDMNQFTLLHDGIPFVFKRVRPEVPCA